MRHHIRMMVNGAEVRVEGADAFLPLAELVRRDRRTTGTKIVCAEGDCGACTVLVGRPSAGGMEYRPLNACILFPYQLDGMHVVTVEGLRAGDRLTAVQEAMIDNHGTQCGYCTPGFVMSLTALSASNEVLTPAAVREGLTGNLCRCTGYDSIIRAALDLDGREGPTLTGLYPPAGIARRLREVGSDDVTVRDDGRLFCAPASLSAALQVKADLPAAVVVQGGTDVGVQWNKRGFRPEVILSLAKVTGLDEITVEDHRLTVGAKATLADLQAAIPEVFPELHRLLARFGSPLIRNAATLAGNIANASPIADTLPMLFVTGASVELTSLRGTRTLAVGALYRGYKQLHMAPDELITRIVIPLPAETELLRLYKVSKRHDLDISTFTAAIRMTIGDRLSGVAIAYGGVAPVVLRLPKTEALLEGKEPDERLFRQAGALARTEIAPISDVRGTAAYRSLLGETVLMKFYFEEIASRTAAQARV